MPYLKDLHWLPVAMQLGDQAHISTTYKSPSTVSPYEQYKSGQTTYTFLQNSNASTVYRDTSLWNSLPNNIRDIKFLDSFKEQIMNRAFQICVEK